MRIYLIGFMGSGKTTLGSRAATSLGVLFRDTDQIIEEKTGKSISELFDEKGEDEFRLMEAQVLRETKHLEKALIATGGGLPLFHRNMEWLLENGITIYLQWPEEILLASLMHHRLLRPLISGLNEEDAVEKAMQLLKARIPVYKSSAITLEMTGDAVQDTGLLEKACKYIW